VTIPTPPDRAQATWINILRWVAFLLACLGIVWDLTNIWWYLSPGPSGEWARLAVAAAVVGGIPSGFFAAIFFFVARNPPTKWRGVILGTAALAITLPILLALYAYWH
jgi:hypothetical protein